MDIHKIRGFHPSITRFKLMLQHSSRKTGNFWIDAALAIFAGAKRRRVIQLGPGSKNDSSEVIQLLTTQGFKITGKRLNQEWEQITLVREQETE
jgi:hypothetical protein